ncbi:hypothetical protein BOTBODRAFT_27137 [Botryobasidium botryosum FD-172 SS1]|uniref:Uncharacterized protein n=1 Tax=Botryobasidium botryosum (strain FD-172 SS1) TaxID=930990 RepID=A0A067N7G0_BOTB1|nr:hypothetical protein BOTBODRAFT_27137 [Botryobasidium botryosum FD-172 SS1]
MERSRLPTRSAALARSDALLNKALPPTPKFLSTPKLPPAPKIRSTPTFPPMLNIPPAPTRLPAPNKPRAHTTRAPLNLSKPLPPIRDDTLHSPSPNSREFSRRNKLAASNTTSNIPLARTPETHISSPKMHLATSSSYTSRGSARPAATRHDLQSPQHTQSLSIPRSQPLPRSLKKYTLVDAPVPKSRPGPPRLLSPSTEDLVASLQVTNARAAALLQSRSDLQPPAPTQRTSSKAVSASDGLPVAAPREISSDREDWDASGEIKAERRSPLATGTKLGLDIGDAPQPRHAYRDRPYQPPRRAKAIIRKGRNQPRAQTISRPQTPVLGGEEVESPVELPTSRFDMSHCHPSTYLLLQSMPIPPPYIPTSGSTRRVQGPRSMRRSSSSSTSSPASSSHHLMSGFTSPSVHTSGGPAHTTGQSTGTPSSHSRSLDLSTSSVSSGSPTLEDSMSQGRGDEVWKHLSSFAPASQIGEEEVSLVSTYMPRPPLLHAESWASPMWKPSPADSPRTNMEKLIAFASSNPQALILSMYEKPLTAYKRKDAALHSLDADVRETFNALRSVPSPAIFDSLGLDDSEDEDEDDLLETPVIGMEKVVGESASEWIARLAASPRVYH